jgi:hypothetical protein
MQLFMLILWLQWLGESVSWLAPLAVSTVTGGVAGYGTFRFNRGAERERLTTLERDVKEARAEHAGLVTRAEFDLLRDDLREMRADIRQILRTLSR